MKRLKYKQFDQEVSDLIVSFLDEFQYVYEHREYDGSLDYRVFDSRFFYRRMSMLEYKAFEFLRFSGFYENNESGIYVRVNYQLET